MKEDLRKKAVLTVEEVRVVLRMGRTKTYEFLNSKTCPVPVIHVGHRLRAPAKQFFDWLDGCSVAAS